MAEHDWLIRVVAPNFVAGAIVHDGTIVDMAPILRALWRPTPRRGRELVQRCRAWGFRVTWTRCED